MNLYPACNRFVQRCPRWSWPVLRFGLPSAVAFGWLLVVGWPAAAVFTVIAVLVVFA